MAKTCFVTNYGIQQVETKSEGNYQVSNSPHGNLSGIGSDVLKCLHHNQLFD